MFYQEIIGYATSQLCIVRGCNDIVRNLSRHLQSRKHDWSKESAKAAVHAYGLRKSYPKSIPSQPNTMESKVCEDQTNTSLKMCPYPSCMSVVKQLDVHLHFFQWKGIVRIIDCSIQ